MSLSWSVVIKVEAPLSSRLLPLRVPVPHFADFCIRYSVQKEASSHSVSKRIVSLMGTTRIITTIFHS